jgi:hypothetical protein
MRSRRAGRDRADPDDHALVLAGQPAGSGDGLDLRRDVPDGLRPSRPGGAPAHADFARFVRKTGHVTVAEQAADPADHPGADWRHPQGPGSSIKKPDHPVVHVAWADVEAYAAWVEDYPDAAHTFLHESRHPTLGRSSHQSGYRPMIELLGTWRPTGLRPGSPPAATATSGWIRPGVRCRQRTQGGWWSGGHGPCVTMALTSAGCQGPGQRRPSLR